MNSGENLAAETAVPMKPGTTIGEQTEPLRALIAGFLARYPRATPRDVYVLLHAGTVGPGDAVLAEPAIAKAGATVIAASSAGVVVEPVAIGGEIARVNLGPALAAGCDLATLLNAARRTAASWRPRRDQIFTFWSGFVHMNRRHEFKFSRDEIDHFEMTIASAGYPPFTHSNAYIEAYRPCYLLILEEYLPRL